MTFHWKSGTRKYQKEISNVKSILGYQTDPKTFRHFMQPYLSIVVSPSVFGWVGHDKPVVIPSNM